MASSVRSAIPDLSVATRNGMQVKYCKALKQSSSFTLWCSLDLQQHMRKLSKH